MDESLHVEILKCLEIYKNTAPSDAVADFTAMSKADLPLCHLGLGLYIRNNHLRHGSKLNLLFVDRDVLDTDEMSGIMIRLWHETLLCGILSDES